MEDSKIEWCDNTFNPWIGCKNVSPGCDNCYAACNPYHGHHWKDNTRKDMADSNWDKPRKWNKKAQNSNTAPKVFCGSMCDVFDKKAPAGQRERLWDPPVSG